MGIPKQVPILIGAADELVTHRELRNTYSTNRSIKTWSTYFLLKSLTRSGIIKNWQQQKQLLLSFCKCTENSFRARLREMQQLKLISLSKNHSVLLTSYHNAADILGIPYTGLNKIDYNYELPGKQIFQYFLRAEEIRSNQAKQLDALWYYAGKNPLLKDALIQALCQMGSDGKRLYAEPLYFQQQLLRLQKNAFKEGSPLLDIIHTLRADVNRSVNGIKKTHTYKSAQSVSYMKKVMLQMQIIKVKKVCIESTERSRLYVSVPGEKKKRDAYKYIPSKKVTAWVLTDQISFNYTSIKNAKQNAKEKQAA